MRSLVDSFPDNPVDQTGSSLRRLPLTFYLKREYDRLECLLENKTSALNCSRARWTS